MTHSNRTAADLTELARQMAIKQYGLAVEFYLLDEFSHIEQCSNHLWEQEAKPLLATVFYLLDPSVQQNLQVRQAMKNLHRVFTDTFESEPDYPDQISVPQFSDQFLTSFVIDCENKQISVPANYDPVCLIRAEEQMIF